MLLQLSRCDSGRQLWSSALVRKVTAVNLFEIQEEIISLITAALGGYYGVIYKDVIDASRNNGNYSDMDAYNVIFWYEQFTKQYDSDTFSKACQSVEFTVKKDPEDALACAVLSELYAIGVVMGFKRLDDQKEIALTLANKAVKLDPMCQHAYQALARACFLTGNKSGVVSASERCYALNPRAASFSARVGVFLIYAGEFERGASILKQSLMANPYFPWVSSLAFSLYHYHRQEFQVSWNWAEKADMPQIPWVNLIKAASMAQLGKLDQAKKEIEMLLVLKPDIAVLGRPYIGSFILDENLVDNIIAGLEKVGLVVQSNTCLSNPS
jgi:tetratricopeptide (TPR) repeat protein